MKNLKNVLLNTLSIMESVRSNENDNLKIGMMSIFDSIVYSIYFNKGYNSKIMKNAKDIISEIKISYKSDKELCKNIKKLDNLINESLFSDVYKEINDTVYINNSKDVSKAIKEIVSSICIMSDPLNQDNYEYNIKNLIKDRDISYSDSYDKYFNKYSYFVQNIKDQLDEFISTHVFVNIKDKDTNIKSSDYYKNIIQVVILYCIIAKYLPKTYDEENKQYIKVNDNNRIILLGKKEDINKYKNYIEKYISNFTKEELNNIEYEGNNLVISIFNKVGEIDQVLESLFAFMSVNNGKCYSYIGLDLNRISNDYNFVFHTDKAKFYDDGYYRPEKRMYRYQVYLKNHSSGNNRLKIYDSIDRILYVFIGRHILYSKETSKFYAVCKNDYKIAFQNMISEKYNKVDLIDIYYNKYEDKNTIKEINELVSSINSKYSNKSLKEEWFQDFREYKFLFIVDDASKLDKALKSIYDISSYKEILNYNEENYYNRTNISIYIITSPKFSIIKDITENIDPSLRVFIYKSNICIFPDIKTFINKIILQNTNNY